MSDVSLNFMEVSTGYGKTGLKNIMLQIINTIAIIESSIFVIHSYDLLEIAIKEWIKRSLDFI